MNQHSTSDLVSFCVLVFVRCESRVKVIPRACKIIYRIFGLIFITVIIIIIVVTVVLTKSKCIYFLVNKHLQSLLSLKKC